VNELPSNFPKPLALAKEPRFTAEAFADLQRRALLKGITLRRSESFGHVRVWAGAREVMSIDDLEAIVNAAAPATIKSSVSSPLARAKASPVASSRQVEDEERIREARMALEAAALAGTMHGMVVGSLIGGTLLQSMKSMNAAESAIESAKRNP